MTESSKPDSEGLSIAFMLGMKVSRYICAESWNKLWQVHCAILIPEIEAQTSDEEDGFITV